jgi:hypothetical protein
MNSISDLSRHWQRQTEKGKGMRIEAGALDLLNARGIGKIILQMAAEEQMEKCSNRIKNSTPAANTDSRTTGSSTDRLDLPSSRSSGTTPARDVTAAAARAQRTSSRRKAS